MSKQMRSISFNEESPHSQFSYLQQVPILTSRHEQKSKNTSENQILKLINKRLFDESSSSPVHEQTPENVEEKHLLLQFLTKSKSKISHQTKKKIIKIRNKNLNHFVKNTHDRGIILKLVAIKKEYKDKQIKDPTKSHVFSFICLALLQQYAQNQQFFNLFDRCETIRKNKRTGECSKQQKQIIKEEMEFFKLVAKRFYMKPLSAILLMYLRNHSEIDISHNQLDPYTIKGLNDTLNMLNSNYFNMGIDCTPLREFLTHMENRNQR